mmetsp:Transcript_19349/g.48990  ORF Transcript_19349/g.48990 Transcript_19349/m.48990 type:complete len:247 (+) Transcript_19349:762-1502(+)
MVDEVLRSDEVPAHAPPRLRLAKDGPDEHAHVLDASRDLVAVEVEVPVDLVRGLEVEDHAEGEGADQGGEVAEGGGVKVALEELPRGHAALDRFPRGVEAAVVVPRGPEDDVDDDEHPRRRLCNDEGKDGSSPFEHVVQRLVGVILQPDDEPLRVLLRKYQRHGRAAPSPLPAGLVTPPCWPPPLWLPCPRLRPPPSLSSPALAPASSRPPPFWRFRLNHPSQQRPQQRLTPPCSPRYHVDNCCQP